MDFDGDGVDAAIRFGPRPDERYYTEVLADEWVTPVCSPGMAETYLADGRIDTTHLVHDESFDFLEQSPDWRAWAKATGAEGDFTHGTRFTNADHVIDVALEGGGLALGRLVLVARYLEKGRLVAPLPVALHSGAQYRFVCPKGQETTPRIETLLDWIRDEVSDVTKHIEGREVLTL